MVILIEKSRMNILKLITRINLILFDFKIEP